MKFKKYIYIPASFLVIVFLVGAVAPNIFTAQNSDRPLAFVRKFRPVTVVQKAGKEREASKAEPLFDGDTLRTEDKGFALVQFMDNSIAKVKPNSMLVVRGEIKGKDRMNSHISLEAGEIFLNVTKRTTTEFEVGTSTSVASVKGTQFGATSQNYYWVVEGLVQVRSMETGKTVNLTKKMFGQVEDDGSITTGELSDEELEKLNKDYENFDANLKPKIIKLRFRDANGQIREIELKYFEN